MEFIPKNPLLEFKTDQLKLVRKQYNLDKSGDMSRAINVLEEWIKVQKHFKKKELPREYLEKIIITNKGSLERAKQSLDKICTLRTMMPDFFGDNLTKNKFDNIYNILKSSLLPKPTDEHYRVYFIKCIGSTFTADQFLNFYRYTILTCEYILANDYSDGIIVVLDYNEANILEIIKALNLLAFRQIIGIITPLYLAHKLKLSEIIISYSPQSSFPRIHINVRSKNGSPTSRYCAQKEEGFRMRLKGIHLLTPSKAIDTLLNIVKQFLSPKLAKRISVHKDINSLCQCVPKDILPIEYGGKEKSLLKLNDELRDEVTKKTFMNYMEEMNKAMIDESCRTADTFDDKYLGMPGSFRTLNVD